MRRAHTSLLATTALVFLGLPALVHAQSVDEAGAQEIEASIPGLLDRLLVDAPQSSYVFDGDIDAVPSGDSYALSVPDLSVMIDAGVTLNVPGFDAQITPQDNGWLRSQWDFPSSFAVVMPFEPDQVDVTLTSQGNDVTIAPEYNLILNGAMGFTDISAQSQMNVASLSIDGLTLDIDTDEEPTAPHTFSSQTSIELTGMQFAVPDEAVSMSLDSLTLGGESADQRLDLFAILDERTRGLNSESEAFVQAFLGTLQEFQNEKWLANVIIASQLEGLSISAPEASGTLDNVSFSFAALELDGPVSDLALTMQAGGLTTAQLPPPLLPVVPTLVALDIEAGDAPLEDVLAVIYRALGEPMSAEEQMGPKGRRAGAGLDLEGLQDLDPQQFLAILLNSDAVLDINAINVEAPIGSVAAQGRIEPRQEAVFQAVGDITVAIEGLDDMIAFSQTMGGDAAEIAVFASVIAAMGRDETNDDGAAVKVFDLELTEGGEILLNDNNMSAIMGMFQ